jgi:hypothetical protein
MPTVRPLLSLAVVLLAACDGTSSPVAPDTPPPDVRAFTAPPALLGALDDAALRLAPSVDAELRLVLSPALAELRAAVDAGKAARSARAIHVVQSLLTAHTADADGDAADLGALGVVVNLMADFTVAHPTTP